MSERTTAQRLSVVNVVLIVVLGALLVVCVVRGLWFPAIVFVGLIASNALQLTLRRRG